MAAYCKMMMVVTISWSLLCSSRDQAQLVLEVERENCILSSTSCELRNNYISSIRMKNQHFFFTPCHQNVNGRLSDRAGSRKKVMDVLQMLRFPPQFKHMHNMLFVNLHDNSSNIPLIMDALLKCEVILTYTFAPKFMYFIILPHFVHAVLVVVFAQRRTFWHQ